MNKTRGKSTGAFCCTKTWLGVVLGGLVACGAFLLLPPRSAQAPRLWMPIYVQTNGNQVVLGETRQMEFWTPSIKTQDYLHKAGAEVVGTEKWQVVSNEAVLEQFGTLLHSNRNVFGYRRIEVWGQGRTTYKPGWWWTLNVAPDFSVVELADTYRQFWKVQEPVFVEVVDNRGTPGK